jgi:hypothetical protein
VFFAGLVIFILVCVSLWHQWQIKKQIAHFTVDGVLIADAASKLLPDDQKAYEALHARFTTWLGEVLNWLKEHDVSAAIYFANDTGRLVTEGLIGGGGIAELRANIDTRMARLGEMAQKRL